MSHGQASVERGFSVNDDMMLPNMKEGTLVGRRVVYDTIKWMGIAVHELQISDTLLRHSSQAHGRYQMHLMEQEKRTQQTAKKRKAEEVEKNLVMTRKNPQIIEDEAESCSREADENVIKCHQTGDLSLLGKSIALKEHAKKVQDHDIVRQRQLISDLEASTL